MDNSQVETCEYCLTKFNSSEVQQHFTQCISQPVEIDTLISTNNEIYQFQGVCAYNTIDLYSIKSIDRSYLDPVFDKFGFQLAYDVNTLDQNGGLTLNHLFAIEKVFKVNSIYTRVESGFVRECYIKKGRKRQEILGYVMINNHPFILIINDQNNVNVLLNSQFSLSNETKFYSGIKLEIINRFKNIYFW